MENEDGYCFQKLGMHEGKKGVLLEPGGKRGKGRA